jgi:chromosome segregation ATPase
MIRFYTAAAVWQATPELAGKGLPYWLLWSLLCIILLLLAVIFLRDKSLRRRMSAFLSGARRKMTQLRLQAKLRKEKNKKASLWRELGKKAWSENLRAVCIEPDCEKLATLDEEMHLHQMTWHEIFSRIEALGRQHTLTEQKYSGLLSEQETLKKPHAEAYEALLQRKSKLQDALTMAESEIETAGTEIRAAEKEARKETRETGSGAADEGSRLEDVRRRAVDLAARVKTLRRDASRYHDQQDPLEKELAEARAKVESFDQRICQIREEKAGLLSTYDREIKEWEKSKLRVQDRIVEIKRLMEPLYESMGRALDESRITHDDLDIIYFQIDDVNRTIADLESRIEHLR